MAMKKISGGTAPATPKQKQAKSKVQASEKSPPKSPVLGVKVTPEDTVPMLVQMFKNGSGVFDPTDPDSVEVMGYAAAFINAMGREPISFDELMAWADTPDTASGRKSRSITAPYGRFLALMKKLGITVPGEGDNSHPTAKGKVREAMKITSPGPRLRVEESSKMKRPAEGFSTVPDRIDSDGARMATRAPSKPRQGKFGLTMDQCKEALKSCKGTPARGYAQPINVMAKTLFQAGTISVTAISSLKAAELNALVTACKEAGLI